MNHNGQPADENIHGHVPMDNSRERISSTGEYDFQVGDVAFSYHGTSLDGQMAFVSVDREGVSRPVLVYRSQSGGSYRVSQGLEEYADNDGVKHWRILKGPEDSDEHQYTQDTQLHPDFDKKLEVIEDEPNLREKTVGKLQPYSQSDRERISKDFESQVTVHPLGTPYLHDILKTLPAGGLSSENIKQVTGFDMQVADQKGGAAIALERKITALNDELEASDCMPDFSEEPLHVGMDGHPQLGSIAIEIFEKVVDGQRVHWHMAHDMNGRAWIERIRLADSEPNAYGTDKDMVYSGLLTSKPLDYAKQVSGIPDSMRKDFGNGYEDITGFLQTLAPLREYSKNYHARDHLYHTVSVA